MRNGKTYLEMQLAQNCLQSTRGLRHYCIVSFLVHPLIFTKFLVVWTLMADYIFSSSRVLPDLTIADLRTDIAAQLDTDILPSNFVFVRGVGRHFTEVCTFFIFSVYRFMKYFLSVAKLQWFSLFLSETSISFDKKMIICFCSFETKIL